MATPSEKDIARVKALGFLHNRGTDTFSARAVSKNGTMTAEQLAWAWIRSELLEPKRLISEPDDLYYKLLEDTISNHEREAYKN